MVQWFNNGSNSSACQAEKVPRLHLQLLHRFWVVVGSSAGARGTRYGLLERRFGQSGLSEADGPCRGGLDLPDYACDLKVTNLLPLWQPGDGCTVGSLPARSPAP